MAVQHPPAPPFTLTDQQADIVLRACKPLRPAERKISCSDWPTNWSGCADD